MIAKRAGSRPGVVLVTFRLPDTLQADNVHPDMDGMHVYAAVVARAFDELARRAG